jgi:hypothetical protein
LDKKHRKQLIRKKNKSKRLRITCKLIKIELGIWKRNLLRIFTMSMSKTRDKCNSFHHLTFQSWPLVVLEEQLKSSIFKMLIFKKE